MQAVQYGVIGMVKLDDIRKSVREFIPNDPVSSFQLRTLDKSCV